MLGVENMLHQPTLKTSRLILRPFDMSDIEKVTRLSNNKNFASNIAIPYPYKIEIAKKWIESH